MIIICSSIHGGQKSGNFSWIIKPNTNFILYKGKKKKKKGEKKMLSHGELIVMSHLNFAFKASSYLFIYFI